MRCSDLHITCKVCPKDFVRIRESCCLSQCRDPGRTPDETVKGTPRLVGWCSSDEVVTGTDNTGFKVKPDTSFVTSLEYFSSLCPNDEGSKLLVFLRALTYMQFILCVDSVELNRIFSCNSYWM